MSQIAARNNCLWTPDDLLDLLSVEVDGESIDSDFQGMITINKSGRLWLNGELDTATYYEVLDHFGINPLEFVGEVEEHVDYLISHG